MFITVEIDLNATKDVLHDYFSIEVPDELLVKIISNDGQLLGEVLDESIRDTYARDLLIGQVLEHIGMQAWPTYGDSNEYKEAFDKELPLQLAKFGGRVIK